MLKNLRLVRPLAVFDLETTGIDPEQDRIVEISILRLAREEQPRSLTLRFDPEQPISASATAVHGIRNEHVASCPRFRDQAKRIAIFIGGADLAGFGIARFDLPFLIAEFERSGRQFLLRGRRVIDALTLFHRMAPRDLSAAVRNYCGREHRKAHSARSDVLATVSVLDAMLGKHLELPRTVKELHRLLVPVDLEGWFRRDGKTICFARGKHREVPLEQIAQQDRSYLRWLSERVLPDARGIIDQAMGNGSY